MQAKEEKKEGGRKERKKEEKKQEQLFLMLFWYLDSLRIMKAVDPYSTKIPYAQNIAYCFWGSMDLRYQDYES